MLLFMWFKQRVLYCLVPIKEAAVGIKRRLFPVPIKIGNGSINNNAVSRKIARSHEYLIISVRVKTIYISEAESFNSSPQKSLSNKSNIGNAALAFHFSRDVSYHLTPNHNYERDIPAEIELSFSGVSDLRTRICCHREKDK